MSAASYPPLCGAMVLAAGRGERMRPLTDHCPKSLLPVRGKPLMQWPMEALVCAGVRSIMVNTAWMGDQIEACFSDPNRTLVSASCDHPAGAVSGNPVRLAFSHEGRDFGGALETAGGIVRVLPQLADPFWLLAGDVFVPEFVFFKSALQTFEGSGKLAHIWLVPNPAHHPNGDFALSQDGMAHNEGLARYTYSAIGLYRHALFAPPFCAIPTGNPQGTKAALAPLLRAATARGRVSAQLYTGPWTDVGTPERLAQLQTPSAS